MKILYIITQADGGGAQKYTLCLAKHFGGAVAAGTEAGKLFINAQRSGLETFELKHLKRAINPWQDLLAIWEIRRLIDFYKPDVVHLNSSKAGILGSFAAIGKKTKAAPRTRQQSWTGTRVVFTAHGFVFNETLPHPVKMFYVALEKIASDYRDFIITVSNADKQSALDYKITNPKKIATVHNGISKINFLEKQQARAALGLPDNKIIIGSVANFYKTKGLDVLINAIGLLGPETKEKIICAVIGEGNERKVLEKQISDLGLKDNIKLLGARSEIPDAIKAFDIFVLASRKEGLPYTILEAMQAGLPIIASNVGGIPEALGNAGILVKPEDPKALAEAITNLIADVKKQQALSQTAAVRSNLFSEEKMLVETEKIYELILKK